ncbi:MAG: hypothetical protein ACK5MN_01990 [Lachnospiraceae bacterium]
MSNLLDQDSTQLKTAMEQVRKTEEELKKLQERARTDFLGAKADEPAPPEDGRQLAEQIQILKTHMDLTTKKARTAQIRSVFALVLSILAFLISLLLLFADFFTFLPWRF